MRYSLEVEGKEVTEGKSAQAVIISISQCNTQTSSFFHSDTNDQHIVASFTGGEATAHK